MNPNNIIGFNDARDSESEPQTVPLFGFFDNFHVYTNGATLGGQTV